MTIAKRVFALAAGLAMLVAYARAARAEESTFGLSISIAKKEKSDARVVDDGWAHAQIAEANRLFQPLGTSFRWVYEKPLPDPKASMHSRADRHGLTALTEKTGFVDVFIVRELEDVDEPGTYRRGVCWTGEGGKRFIVLSQIAGIGVLAHELGHFFGNGHVSVVDNVMSYSRTPGELSFFDAGQQARIRTFSTRFVATGRLVDVGPAWRFF